ncbi:MAG: 16S rRNA (adenine(1518)-N(6)/adenine(1519)-N(6))-dimethyltransferase RsmA [Candidatus Micrarchaeota archaeon]
MQKGRLNKRLGQHFLDNVQALRLEATLIETEGKDILEIGAGDGRLSSELLAQNPKSLTLIEIDKKWAAHLAKKFSSEKSVQILNQDFLELPENFKTQVIYGNIPYNITSKILAKLAKMDFENCILCMQKEVVERICAPPSSKRYGRLSVFCQLHFYTNPLHEIPREFFTPPPKVDSQLVQLIPKDASHLPKNLEQISAALFSHRLASAKNALFHSRKMFGWQKEQARAHISKRLKTEKKVFMLSPGEVVEIAKAFEDAK